MNFLIENWFLIVAALVSGGMLVWPLIVSGSQGAALTPAQAVQLVNREKGVLIDVSEPEEYAKGHAVGARNIPFGQIEGHKQLPSNKSLPLVLLCPTGARAGRAAGMLRKLGYEKAQVLGGGLKAWRDANLPVEKSA
ncbi:rhodanese-like domain-containing protein [Pelomonas sp. UHG3]|uniref:Rhodanese-like domain-containing protein n=1 Tax=Roseateles hydrophilus TaxID=2975054 RepID=A0ACC6C5H3_9BURK|nr:rhodanese-like domain-containing protein [Pelomonas sp. UHG3]MCY4743579.1 rhodanese-like domain-containing protein [Pelomonas sp. UHG3]